MTYKKRTVRMDVQETGGWSWRAKHRAGGTEVQETRSSSPYQPSPRHPGKWLGRTRNTRDDVQETKQHRRDRRTRNEAEPGEKRTSNTGGSVQEATASVGFAFPSLCSGYDCNTRIAPTERSPLAALRPFRRAALGSYRNRVAIALKQAGSTPRKGLTAIAAPRIDAIAADAGQAPGTCYRT